MRICRYKAAAITFVIALLTLPVARAQAATDELFESQKIFMDTAIANVLKILRSQLTEKARKERIDEFLSNTFEIEQAGTYIFSNFWKRFKPAQKKAFLTRYRQYIVLHYGPKVGGKKCWRQIISQRGKDRFTVNVTFQRDGSDETIGFTLYKSSNGHRIVDIVNMRNASILAALLKPFREIFAVSGYRKMVQLMDARLAKMRVQAVTAVNPLRCGLERIRSVHGNSTGVIASIY